MSDMCNSFEDLIDNGDKFGFGENKRIYEESCARLAKEQRDRTAEVYRARIQEIKPELEYKLEWMKTHGYTV